MSRLGRKPVIVPEKVKVAVSGTSVSAEGPAGKNSLTLPVPITAKLEDGGKKVQVSSPAGTKHEKALWGTWRSHVANMLEGVEKGYEKILELTGVGYNARIQGDQLVMALGFSHPVEMKIPKELAVKCESATVVSVKGIDKQQVGQFAAEIRGKRPAEPYNLKGIKYRDEVVRRKAGKTFVTGGST